MATWGSYRRRILHFSEIGGVWDSLKNALHLGDIQIKKSLQLGYTVGRSDCGNFWLVSWFAFVLVASLTHY